MLQIEHPIPDFVLQSDRAGEVSRQSLLGQWYVIFVYPKDDTYG